MEKKVQVPAIGLIVLGILGVVFGVSGLLVGRLDEQRLIEIGYPEEAAHELGEALAAGGAIALTALQLVNVLASAFVAWAGFQMLKLHAWTACVIASVLVMIPCFSGCCCVLGLPLGVWGLVVLLDQDVRRAFEAGGPPPAFTT